MNRNASASKVQGAMKYVMNDAGPAADDAVTTRDIYLNKSTTKKAAVSGNY